MSKICNDKINDAITRKVHQAARVGSFDLEDLLNRLNTDERKTVLLMKTQEGNEITTLLIIAARNGRLNSVKTLLSYKTDIEAQGTSRVGHDSIVLNLSRVTQLYGPLLSSP